MSQRSKQTLALIWLLPVGTLVLLGGASLVFLLDRSPIDRSSIGPPLRRETLPPATSAPVPSQAILQKHAIATAFPRPPDPLEGLRVDPKNELPKPSWNERGKKTWIPFD